MAATRGAQKTAAEDLGHLLDAGEDAVVTLVAGETRLAVHRAVLEARSPVFESVFGHTTLEATSRQFKVRNVEGPLLRRLVAYCYTLEASQLLSMDPQLLEAADELGLSCLKDVTDQQTPTVRLGSLLDARSDAIVTLVAGETRLQAHRSVLETRSPGFKSKFSQSRSGQFPVTNVEGPVLRQLVAYCYTLQAPQLPEMALQLLAAAATYGLPDLKDVCEQQAVRQLTVENAIEAGVLAVRHSCSTLKQAAVAFLKTHIHEVVTTQGWYANKDRYPHDLLDLIQLILSPSAETRTPATAEGAPTTGTDRQLQRDRGQSPATAAAAAAPPMASRRTPPPDSTAVSQKKKPATATPSSHRQPRSDPSSRSPATAAAPPAPHHTAPPDDAAISRLRRLSQQERNRRLIEAANQGSVPELRALLVAGADVAARSEAWERWTALHCAAERGHEEAARCLVEAGAEVGARDRLQHTPLHLAAWAGHTAVVRLLLAASADPNARSEWAWTPLHGAALNGRAAPVAAALLEGGADRGARDEGGKTPLDMARLLKNQQLIQMLTQ